MVRYPFFRRLGAFSIDTENPGRNFRALRYAIRSMNRPRSSLYIFPEGGLVPFSTDLPVFKPGIYWLSQYLEGVDFVPVGIYVHMLRGDRPELHVRVGEKVTGPFESEDRPLEYALQRQLLSLQESAGFCDESYERWL